MRRAVWHSMKRVIDCELRIQNYWWRRAESLPSGSEEAEQARRQSWSSYWRRVEIWQMMESRAREWCCDVCPFGLTCAADGRSPGCTVLVGIVVRYTLLYIIGGIMGASL